MNILHLDTETGWRGGQQQLLYLLGGLRAAGISCLLLGPPDAPLLKAALSAGVEARPIRARGEADLPAARCLAGLIRDEPFDVLHCHTAHAHSLALAARWFVPRGRMPKLVVARRVVFRPPGPDLFGLRRWKYRRVDRVIAVSEAVKAVLVRTGVEASRIRVVRDGIDVSRVERAPEQPGDVRRAFGLREGERIIASVAHFGEEKGQSDLIAAARTIRAAQSNARVLLVGQGDLRADLEAQARALGLCDTVVFAGFQPLEEVWALLKATDVFVYPSVEEGLGSTLLDAMAAGAAIVATRAGGIPEIVRDGETGLLVPPRDPEALALAVLRVLGDPALARRLSEAGRRFVRAEGTTERMVEETVRVYQEIVPLEPSRATPAAGG